MSLPIGSDMLAAVRFRLPDVLFRFMPLYHVVAEREHELQNPTNPGGADEIDTLNSPTHGAKKAPTRATAYWRVPPAPEEATRPGLRTPTRTSLNRREDLAGRTPVSAQPTEELQARTGRRLGTIQAGIPISYCGTEPHPQQALPGKRRCLEP
jgi:hypothetical protein